MSVIDARHRWPGVSYRPPDDLRQLAMVKRLREDVAFLREILLGQGWSELEIDQEIEAMRLEEHLRRDL